MTLTRIFLTCLRLTFKSVYNKLLSCYNFIASKTRRSTARIKRLQRKLPLILLKKSQGAQPKASELAAVKPDCGGENQSVEQQLVN